ncbi:MAG: hypothetical protein AAF663_01775 [Planctomycetota bacterium]
MSVEETTAYECFFLRNALLAKITVGASDGGAAILEARRVLDVLLIGHWILEKVHANYDLILPHGHVSGIEISDEGIVDDSVSLVDVLKGGAA